jgi:hypothetical protein
VCNRAHLEGGHRGRVVEERRLPETPVLCELLDRLSLPRPPDPREWAAFRQRIIDQAGHDFAGSWRQAIRTWCELRIGDTDDGTAPQASRTSASRHRPILTLGEAEAVIRWAEGQPEPMVVMPDRGDEDEERLPPSALRAKEERQRGAEEKLLRREERRAAVRAALAEQLSAGVDPDELSLPEELRG